MELPRGRHRCVLQRAISETRPQGGGRAQRYVEAQDAVIFGGLLQKNASLSYPFDPLMVESFVIPQQAAEGCCQSDAALRQCRASAEGSRVQLLKVCFALRPWLASFCKQLDDDSLPPHHFARQKRNSDTVCQSHPPSLPHHIRCVCLPRH